MARLARVAFSSTLLLGACSSAVLADACRRTGDKQKSAQSVPCGPDQRVEPYEPARVRAGRNPGFIDLGNGTEVSVGGRVRMDYDRRR